MRQGVRTPKRRGYLAVGDACIPVGIDEQPEKRRSVGLADGSYIWYLGQVLFIGLNVYLFFLKASFLGEARWTWCNDSLAFPTTPRSPRMLQQVCKRGGVRLCSSSN